MSIIKNISSLPNTSRTFNDEANYSYIAGYFITKKQTLFTEAESLDSDNWYNLLGSVLIPLHYIKEVEHANEETIYKTSAQDYTFKLRDGKYKQRAKFTWTMEKHSLVEQFSGSDLYIIPYDKKGNIYCVVESGNVRGIKTTRIDLEKMLYPTESTPAFSLIDVEFAEKYTDIINVGFSLLDIDRLFMMLDIQYVDSNNINFSASYQGNDIDDIGAADITVTDNVNGYLDFGLFNYFGGVYKLSDFDKTVTGGVLTIVSDLWIACKQYTYSSVIQIVNNFIFEDGENFIFEDGNNFIFEN